MILGADFTSVHRCVRAAALIGWRLGYTSIDIFLLKVDDVKAVTRLAPALAWISHRHTSRPELGLPSSLPPTVTRACMRRARIM